jgi:subtilisin family serine protease
MVRLLATLVAAAATTLPSDPLVDTASFESAGLPAAWSLTTGSPDVVIGVMDSGVDAAHPDLAGAVLEGRNFVDEKSDTSDPFGHGTAVAGILAARANNSVGSAGVCWRCRLLPLRVLRPEGFAYKLTMARALDWAVDHGVAVVNISLYDENRNGVLHDAIHRARAAGVLVVTAAGNEGWATLEYPAAYPDAISVGALGADGRLADYSNHGSWVKLAAPACLTTTQIGGGFGAGCGTSGSTPVVAGIVALMRAQAPFASAQQIETALERTATPIAGVRFGRVDAYAALHELGTPALKLRPAIDGHAYVGATLEALSGVWAGADVELTYRWERCRAQACTLVGRAQSYRLLKADRGRRLRVVIGAPQHGLTSTSARTGVVR